MIFVDASALTAVIVGEPAADAILDSMESGAALVTSPVSVYETALAVARVANYSVVEALSEVREFLSRARIAVTPIDDSHAEEALIAFSRFGKGRHPAALNMGDCFSYAAAKLHRARILFKGDDFSQTDLPSALLSR